MALGKMFRSVKQPLPVGRGVGARKAALPPPKKTISADVERALQRRGSLSGESALFVRGEVERSVIPQQRNFQ